MTEHPEITEAEVKLMTDQTQTTPKPKCRASWSDGECMLPDAECPNPHHGDPSHCPQMKDFPRYDD